MLKTKTKTKKLPEICTGNLSVSTGASPRTKLSPVSCKRPEPTLNLCSPKSSRPLRAPECSQSTLHRTHPIPLYINFLSEPGLIFPSVPTPSTHLLPNPHSRDWAPMAGRKAVCQSRDLLGPRRQFSQVLCDTKGKQKARRPYPLPLPLPLQPARWADRLGGGGGEKGKKGRLCKGKQKRQRDVKRQETGRD